MRLRNIFTVLLIATTLVGCGGTGTPSSKENIVKIRSITASEAGVEPVSLKARNRKEANDVNEDEYNYVIITKDVTDVQFTITLDNPEAYGIDALRVSCDDPEAQIQVEGEWKPISQEANGTRVVNWSSEDPYEKTYNIRTTSLEDLYTFKVVDIRLAGHDTFLSKQTNSTDFGNNELDIYKMDTDAYELDVISNTFEEIKFGIKVKEGITNLSNFKVDGKEPNEEGYWVMNESKEDCEISYDFELENGMKVRDNKLCNIELLEFTKSGINAGSHPDNRPSNLKMAIEIKQESDTTYFTFAFKINQKFDIYYDDVKLEYVSEYSAYEGYYDYPTEPNYDTYFNFYTFKTDESVNIDDYNNMIIESYARFFSSVEKLDDFLNKFVIKVYDVNYTFIPEISEMYNFLTGLNDLYWLYSIIGLEKLEA